MQEKLVSIILLTWNGSSYIEDCLDSIERQRYRPLELIVVDNGSTDGTDEILRASIPSKISIPWKTEYLPTNSGFSAGMNRGINQSDGKYILTLNQDLKMEENYISFLVEEFEKDRDRSIGSATGKILQWNKDTNKDNEIIDSAGHEIFSDRIVEARGKDQPSHLYDTACPVFGVSAAAAMYSRQALECVSVGYEFFDKDFFSYLEDIDLDYRLILNGYESRYVPNAVAWHVGAGSGGRKDFEIRFKAHTNRYLVWIKNEHLSELRKDLAPILSQEAFQFVRTLTTSPLLFLSWLDFPSKARRMIHKRKMIYGDSITDYSRLRGFIKSGRLASKFSK